MNCKILKGRKCEITQGCNNNHLANDIVGGGYTLDYIIAHTKGKVVFCQDGLNNMKGSSGNTSYGNCVIIEHENGYQTLYAHMKKGLSVKPGQYVEEGQVLGYMSDSGNAYDGHLHFEVRNNGNRINPTEFLNKDFPKKEKINHTGTITYQAYTNKWLSEVSKVDNTDDGYAGVYGQSITSFRCKPEYGEIVYEAHELGGKWIGAVNSKDYSDGTGNSYAGYLGKKIDGIRIKSTKGHVDYRVHTIEDGWLDWARGFGYTGNEFAGIYGHTIDGIQMK